VYIAILPLKEMCIAIDRPLVFRRSIKHFDLLFRLSEMTKVDMTVTATRETDGLSLSTTSRGEKRTDFSDSLPKRAKKKRKQFAVRKPNYGFESDSDFEN